MREFRGPYTCCGPSRGMICRNRKEMSDGWNDFCSFRGTRIMCRSAAIAGRQGYRALSP